MEEREDYEDFDSTELLEDLIKAQRKRFIEGCEEGYELLMVNGSECLSSVPEDQAKEALRRMLGHFEKTEEFEKCTFILGVYKDNYKGKIEPTYLEDI